MRRSFTRAQIAAMRFETATRGQLPLEEMTVGELIAIIRQFTDELKKRDAEATMWMRDGHDD
jgi:hypothetical protein